MPGGSGCRMAGTATHHTIFQPNGTSIMTAKALRIGIIGCGGIGQEHARRLQFKLQGSRVVALNDINRGATEAFNEASGIGAKVYEHYQDVIQAPDVDALLIA